MAPGVLEHRTHLVALELADEVPGEVEVVQRGGLRAGILVPVLADVVHAQLRPARATRDAGWNLVTTMVVIASASRPASRAASATCPRTVSSRWASVPPSPATAGYFRKSGTSRSSLSSSNAWSTGAVTGCSDSPQAGASIGCGVGSGGREAAGGAAAAPGVLVLEHGLTAVEAGRDDGDTHLVAEGVVDDRAEDDVRFGMHGLLDEAGRVVDLEDSEVRAALHRDEHAVRAVDAGFEQR